MPGCLQVLLPDYAMLVPHPSHAAPTRPQAEGQQAAAAPRSLKGKFAAPPSRAAAAPGAPPPSSSLPVHELVRRYLPPAGPVAAAEAAGTGAAALSAGSDVDDGSSGGWPVRLSPQRRLATAFRVHKKMVLADLVLRSGLAPSDILQSAAWPKEDGQQ